MAQRKIIQISAVNPKENFYSKRANVFALCDDGSLWVRMALEGEAGFYWYRVPDVPQGNEKTDYIAPPSPVPLE